MFFYKSCTYVIILKKCDNQPSFYFINYEFIQCDFINLQSEY